MSGWFFGGEYCITGVHPKQVLTYLRLMDRRVGLLINFGGATLKEGLRRIVNRYSPSVSATPRLRVNQPGGGSRGDAEGAEVRADEC